MNRFDFIFEHSPWYALLCLIVAAAYAVLLYRQKHIWSLTVNRLLTALRFITVFIIAMLLLVPMVKMMKNIIEKPIVALVIDNSQSMEGTGADSLLAPLASQLTEQGYEVKWNSLNKVGESPDELSYQLASTNLTNALKGVSQEYYNRNLAATVLVSDGIHNAGFSPEYFTTQTPVYTIGVGDTTPLKDISVQDVKYNGIAFAGNRFPVNVTLRQQGYEGKDVTVSISSGGETITSSPVSFNDAPNYTATFTLTAGAPGKQPYTITVSPLEGEASEQNNVRDIYINIVDSKERILIFAAGPHPDIKAIRQSLEGQQQVETTVYYSGFTKKPEGMFDLIILHHVPTRKVPADPILTSYLDKKIPVWHFIGNDTDFGILNRDFSTINLTRRSGKNDEVSGVLNPNFSGFELKEENLSRLPKFPPVSVPFADFVFKGREEHLLHQQIGSLNTGKPLLTFVQKTDGSKTAYFFGDGLWIWKLNEFKQFGNTKGTDELIRKTARYITTRNDKRKLKVTPVREEFFTNEPSTVDIEVYNDIYEKIYQQKVSIELTNSDGFQKEYTFVNDELKSRFSFGQLDKGVYEYTATATINGKQEKDVGSFVVKEQYLEALSGTANHELLRRISAQNGGQFYQEEETAALTQYLSAQPHPSKIMLTDEILEELIHQKWLFFLIMLLLTVEWAVRKYSGGY